MTIWSHFQPTSRKLAGYATTPNAGRLVETQLDWTHPANRRQ